MMDRTGFVRGLWGRGSDGSSRSPWVSVTLAGAPRRGRGRPVGGSVGGGDSDACPSAPDSSRDVTVTNSHPRACCAHTARGTEIPRVLHGLCTLPWACMFFISCVNTCTGDNRNF